MPESTGLYQTKSWHGGTVFIEKNHPNILFAKDGEVFDFDDVKAIVIGGAYSVDKFYRLERGWNWWKNEQPSAEIKQATENKLSELGNQVDVVLSHTCPLKYEPIEVFLGGIADTIIHSSASTSWNSCLKMLSRLCHKNFFNYRLPPVLRLMKNRGHFLYNRKVLQMANS